MSSEKYIGLDVHQATISVAVMDSQGKLIMESILETKASTILEFLAGLRGTLWLTFEEGTWAAWLYDLLKPHVAHLIVCNPRKNALLKQGNKSDKIDARKLAERLRLHDLKPVYHGETGVRICDFSCPSRNDQADGSRAIGRPLLPYRALVGYHIGDGPRGSRPPRQSAQHRRSGAAGACGPSHYHPACGRREGYPFHATLHIANQ